MQLSNIPGKLVLPFANGGGKTTIPVASQVGITAGAASLTDGFPPLTRTPIAAGGVPPSGLDMNGILYELSAILRWVNAGGGYAYDGTFATDSNVGGYPKGARIMRSDGLGYWFNTVENNTTDPEVAGAAAAGWVPDFTNGVTTVAMASANVTLTPLQYGKPIIVITGTLTANLNLIFPTIVNEWTVINDTTGAFTVTCKTAAGTGVIVNASALIVGDGTNIQNAATADAGGIVYTPAGVGAAPTFIQTRNRLKVYLEDYGGSPSASAATNNAAFDAALAVSNEIEILTPGTWEFSTPQVWNGRKIVARSRRAVELAYTGSGIAILAGGSDVTPCHLEGFRLLGTAAAAGALTVGIPGTGCRRSVFRELYVSGFTRAGVYGLDLAASINNGIYYNNFQKVDVDGCANGIRVCSSDGAVNGNHANANTFSAITSNANIGDGLFIDYGNGNVFEGLTTELNGGFGININHTLEAAFYGGYSEHNTSGAMNKTANAGRVHYVGRRTIDAFVGTYGAPGDFFTSDSITVDNAGNIVANTIKNYGGIAMSGAGVNANMLNMLSGDTVAVSGTNVMQLTTTYLNVMKRMYLNATNVILTAGAGSPEGVVSAFNGSLYCRTDGGAGTSFYVKESGSGNTGWVAK